MRLAYPAAYNRDVTGEFLEDVLGTIRACYARLGPAFILNLYRQPHLFLLSPAATNFVLRSPEVSLSAKEASLATGKQLFGNAFLFEDGADHALGRRAFGPLFTRPGMDEYVSKIVGDTLAQWSKRDATDIFQESQVLFLTVACRLMFNWEPGPAARPLVELLEVLATGLYSVTENIALDSRYRAAVAAKEELYAFWDHNLSKLSFAASDVQLRTFSSEGKSWLYNNLNMILWAAFDTCSGVFSFLINHLLMASDDKVLADYMSPACATRVPRFERALTESLVYEALRLWPPVYAISRTAMTDLEFEGRLIASGTVVTCCPAMLHRLPQEFAAPDEFLPLRFIAGTRVAEQAGAFIPFGIGVKRCIGAGMAMRLLRIATETLVRDTVLQLIHPINGVSWVPGLRPSRGPLVEVSERLPNR